MFWLVILLFAEIFLLLIFFLLFDGDIFSPSVLMSAMFFVSTFVALLNAQTWSIEYSPLACFLILSGIFVFGLGEFLVKKCVGDRTHLFSSGDIKCLVVSKWKIFLAIMFDVIILYLYYSEMKNIVINAGYSMNALQYNFRRIVSVEKTNSISTMLILLTKFLDGSAYVMAYIFINNVIICKEKIINNIIYTFPVLLFVVKTLLSGGRQDILRIAFFCIVSSYLLLQQKWKWKLNISVKYIFISILAFSLVMPIFYFILTLTGRQSTRTFFQVFSTYIGGSIYHFSSYVVDPIEKSSFWGNETFTPILNTLSSLGIIEYNNSVHLEFRYLGDILGNVYTFFRRPLQDFGYIGMYIFTIGVSVFFALFYYKKIKVGKTGTQQNMLNIIYAYIFYWIMLSSVEQYSIGIISVHTVSTILVMYILNLWYTKISIKKGTIVIRLGD